MNKMTKVLAAVALMASTHAAIAAADAPTTASNSLNITVPNIVSLTGSATYSLDSAGLVNSTTGLPEITTDKVVAATGTVTLNSNVSTAKLTVNGLTLVGSNLIGSLASSAAVADATNFTNQLQFSNLRFLKGTTVVANFNSTDNVNVGLQSSTTLSNIKFDVPSNANNTKRLVPGIYTATVGLTVSES